MISEISLRPSAARLLESMRDIGYSFETAIADIVDNSISAQASCIRILNDVDDGGGPFVAIVDDGFGMSAGALTDAMRHGSRSPREARSPEDLGRFGLGLKTASFSQCTKLTVVSRQDGLTSARAWDLDRVIERDDWLLKILSDDEIAQLPGIDMLGKAGTLVLWQGLDRLDAHAPASDAHREALNELFSKTRLHLALTFHRYLAPDVGERGLVIEVNGHRVEAVDPFARRLGSSAEPVEVIETANGRIAVQAFTLPHHSRLTPAQLEAISLGRSLRETQGLYIYRSRRLIAGGTWAGLAPQSELHKLLRVRVDVPTDLDREWGVDVRKSRIRPPAIVRRRLRPLVQRMCESGRRPYVWRGQKQATGAGMPLWNRVTERGSIRYQLDRNHPLVRCVGNPESDPALRALLTAVEASMPIDLMFSDYATDPHAVSQERLGTDDLRTLLATFLETLEPGSNHATQATVDLLLRTPPFAGDERVLAIIDDLRPILSSTDTN